MNNLSEKEFLQEIASMVSTLTRDIEAAERGLDPSSTAVAARRKRVLGGDFEFFVYTYFPHHMWLDEGASPSEFQAFFMKWLPNALRVKNGWKHWFPAPRGEGKSTLAAKIAPVYISVLGLLQRADVRQQTGLTAPAVFIDYVILFGAESRMPQKTLEVVKTELLNNNNLALDFPELCQSTAVWKLGEFVTATGVRFESRGADQSVRGAFHGASRLKLGIGDDLITDVEAKSPTVRNDRWRWLEAGVQFLGPPDGSMKFIGVNTILHEDDPISRAKNAPGHVVHDFKALITMPTHMDMWQRVNELLRYDDKEVLIKAAKRGDSLPDEDLPSFKYWARHNKKLSLGAKTSWPSVRSLYTLMKMRFANKREFDREMQGQPKSDEDRIFWRMEFWVNRLNDWVTFGACDPSMGKSEKSDPYGILVGHWSRLTQQLHVDVERRKKAPPSQLLKDLITMQKEFRCLAIGFENNVAFEHMRADFVMRASEQGVPLPLVGVTATISMDERIGAMEPFVTNSPASILFKSDKNTLLIDELESWPDKSSNHHYDLLSTLQILQMMAISRGNGTPAVASKPRSAIYARRFQGF